MTSKWENAQSMTSKVCHSKRGSAISDCIANKALIIEETALAN